MSEMVVQGSKHSAEQRRAAAVEYAVKGNMVKVAESTGINRSTLQCWKKQAWWDDLVSKVQHEKTEQMRADYVRIVQAAQEQTMNELPNATAQQAATVGAIAFDKVRLIDNAPTRITSGTADMLALAKQFQAITHQLRNERVVAVQEKEPQDEAR